MMKRNTFSIWGPQKADEGKKGLGATPSPRLPLFSSSSSSPTSSSNIFSPPMPLRRVEAGKGGWSEGGYKRGASNGASGRSATARGDRFRRSFRTGGGAAVGAAFVGTAAAAVVRWGNAAGAAEAVAMVEVNEGSASAQCEAERGEEEEGNGVWNGGWGGAFLERRFASSLLPRREGVLFCFGAGFSREGSVAGFPLVFHCCFPTRNRLCFFFFVVTFLFVSCFARFWWVLLPLRERGRA